MNDAWPALPYDNWRATCTTLHMWTQVVGKVRLALAPQMNHWWQVALYVGARDGKRVGIHCDRNVADGGGAPGENRTPNLRGRNPLLYPLSYGGVAEAYSAATRWRRM